MMPSSQVRRLRVNVRDARAATRARRLLAEAVRNANLEHSSRRMYIVRSLKLGVVRASARPHVLTSLIETDARRLQRMAVRAELGAAADAPVVVFESALGACVALALRLSRGERPAEWFWPLAVPGYRSALGCEAALRAVVFGALDNEPAALSAAAFLSALCRQHCVLPVLRSLRAEDGSRLWARCGWEPGKGGAPVQPADFVPPAVAVADSVYATAVRLALADPQITDDSTAWLATVLLLADAPHRAHEAALPERGRRWVSAVARSAQGVESAESSAAATGSALPRTGRDARREIARDEAGDSVPHEIARHAARERATAARQMHGGDRRTIHGRHAAAQPTKPLPQAEEDVACATFDSPRATSDNAGLLLLLNAAARLGIDEWLAANPQWSEWGIVPRLFAALTQRLEIGDTDPMLAAIPGPIAEREPPPSFAVPDSWRWLVAGSATKPRAAEGAVILSALSGRLPLAGWRDGSARSRRDRGRAATASGSRRDRESIAGALAGAWINAMRLWCRRYAGLGLQRIARRPGRVECSATHVDVWFAPELADIRLRRAGLDLDPGWVPWFGRIVQFHYGAGTNTAGTL